MDKKINYQINGLRFFLCLFIIAFHFLIRYFELFSPGSLLFDKTFFPDAIHGWGLFFIIGGFFLSEKIVNVRFFKSRLLKLYCPFIIAVSIILIFKIIFFSDFNFSLSNLLANYAVYPMLSGRFQYIDGAHWYVVVLFYVYFLFVVFELMCKLLKIDIKKYLLLAFSIISIIVFFLNSPNIIIKIFKVVFDWRINFFIFG